MPSFTIEEYLTKDFFQLIGLDSLSDEQKDVLLSKMNHTVLARVYAHIYSDLAEPEREELDHISVDNILPFLAGRGYDVAKMITEEALRYRMELAQMLEIATTPLASKQEESSVAN